MKIVRSGLILWSLTLVTTLLIGSCSSNRPVKLRKFIQSESEKPLHEHHFTGILFMDAESGEVLYSNNADRYFTPASNTKIATLYTALKLIPENVPSVLVAQKGDTLSFSGTGDPSALHPEFRDSTLVKYLGEFEHLVWYTGNYLDNHFGPGWAWEDFPYGFSAERSILPMYGNMGLFTKQDVVKATPPLFKDSIHTDPGKPYRLEDQNKFTLPEQLSDTIQIPFTNTTEVVSHTLESLLEKTITIRSEAYSGDMQIVPGHSRDSLCIKMMVDSDNFLAEQLMVMASLTVGDTLSFTTARDSVLYMLSDIPNPPRWVDGSGLSRYNIFTPGWIVGLLHKLYKEYPQEQLLGYFPAGGVSGTIEDWYGAKDGPYVFAKTGTLGNNYNVSGYLRTKKDRVVIFSIMNNHFREPTNTIRTSIQRTLNWVRQNY
ncbi:MAG: D-alanyl-D-alanine carboxypeptidase [Eudoraea sp.]|nr:D-alanyl-D-alanine carboxypeptidase [Eudoraea sp.]NNE03828.1 D-alanyl-D-alanine carboxypeptidase [Eudoraea sp.]